LECSCLFASATQSALPSSRRLWSYGLRYVSLIISSPARLQKLRNEAEECRCGWRRAMQRSASRKHDFFDLNQMPI
jgi:hypothetical protein